MLTIARLKHYARTVRRDIYAVFLAARDPRVPWAARALAIAVAGYALSPIDLIPDFIPVLGLVDDLILVPLGLWAVLRLIPAGLLAEHRAAAEARAARPVSWIAAAVIMAIWIGAAATLLSLLAD